MKNVYKGLGFGLALALLILNGCSLDQNQTGAIKLGVPATARATSDNTKIVLSRNGQQIEISAEFSGNTIVINGLPPGSGYNLSVAFGTRHPSGYFEVDRYTTARDFSVDAGTDTGLTLKLADSPFTVLAPAFSATAVVGSDVYRLVGNNLFKNGGADGTNILPAGVIPRSLSTGYRTASAELFINTNKGIFAKNTIWEAITPELNVNMSWSMVINSTPYTFFYGGGINMGFNNTTHLPGSDWNTIASALAGAPEFIKVLEEFKGDLLGGVVFNIANRFGFISTPFFTLRLSSGNAGSFDTMFSGDTSIANNLLISIPGAATAIERLAMQGSNLWASPRSGLYRAVINNTPDAGEITQNFALVPGTERLKVQRMEVGGTNNYLAAVGHDGRLVIVNGATVLRDIPAAAGMPAGPYRLSWKDAVLYVDGSNGSVSLTL